MYITKEALDKATEIFRSGDTTSTDFSEALKIYSNYRQNHWHVLNTFQATLRKRIEKLKIPKKDFIVAFRSKRVESVINKLKDKDWLNLEKMQDIGGLRAIVNTIDDVYKIVALYDRDDRLTHEFKGKDDYIKEPRESGYRSIHLKFKAKYNPGSKGKQYNGLRIELQVRTKIQHYRATAVEVSGMYLVDPFLKLGKGTRIYHEYFKLASQCFALHENKETDIALFGKFKKMNDDLNMTKQLFAFSKIMDIKKDQIKRGAYIVIHLNPSDEILAKFDSYPGTKKGFIDANLYYSEIEKGILEKKSIKGNIVKEDVVMVSGKDIKRLKAQFPNYFSDASNFILTTEKIFKLVI